MLLNHVRKRLQHCDFMRCSHVALCRAVRCLLRMYRRARLHKVEDHVMSVLDDADAQVCVALSASGCRNA